MHRGHHLSPVPGFGTLQHVPRIGVNIEAAAAGGEQTTEELGHHLIKLAE
jgi:hypothetical protein